MAVILRYTAEFGSIGGQLRKIWLKMMMMMMMMILSATKMLPKESSFFSSM